MRIFDTLKCCTEAEGRDYTANELNQYTAIDSFTPEYDLDGNQTTIQTSTGIWTVEYNAENRPVRWTQGNIEIEMAYDRMGRRILYHETRDGSNYIYAKFVYNGYLCIQRLYGSSNGVYQSFVWDPTEPTATRPLCMQVPSWGSTVFYMHDGNKNVSDLIYYALANGIAAHYDYAPFGAVTRTARDTRMTQHTFIAENPFRFSSEYHDNTLGLVYYNYRHYNPKDGRWCGRDLMGEMGCINMYCAFKNNALAYYDCLGLFQKIPSVGSPFSLVDSVVGDSDRPSPPPVGPIEEWIPVWGAIRGWEYALYNGDVVEGSVHLASAIADTTMIKPMLLATSLSKGCWKVGSHRWRATRSWYGRLHRLPFGTHVHHQFITQNGLLGKHIPSVIKNQPWNLNPVYAQNIRGVQLASHEMHQLIHGHSLSKIKLTRFEKWSLQYSDVAKTFQLATGAQVLESVFFTLETEFSFEEELSLHKECDADAVYLDGEKLED